MEDGALTLPPREVREVVVAGRGIIGMATALELARRGVGVTLVGPPVAAYPLASVAAGGMLGVLGEVTTAEPPESEELVARIHAGRRYPDWVASFVTPARAGLGWGTVVVAGAQSSSDLTNLTAIEVSAQASGAPVHRLSVDDLPAVRPHRRHTVLAALELPQEGWVDAVGVMHALDESVRAAGVEIVDEEVGAIAAENGAVQGLALRGGRRFPADAVVVAAGARSSALLAASGLAHVAPEVFPAKGTSLVLRPRDGERADVVLRTPNRAFACGVHVVPRPDGCTYLGATNRFASILGATGGATAAEVHVLLDSAIHELDLRLAHADVLGVTHGYRPLSIDGRPVCGMTEVAGLVVATGTYRNGILLAPLMAAVAAAALTREADPEGTPLGWSPSVHRSAPSTTQLLAESAQQVIDMLTEPGASLPYDGETRLRALLQVALPALLADPDSGPLAREVLQAAPLFEAVPELLVLLAETNGAAS